MKEIDIFSYIGTLYKLPILIYLIGLILLFVYMVYGIIGVIIVVFSGIFLFRTIYLK